MTPNPQPPTNHALSDVLSPATREIYDKSQLQLKRAMVALDILIVLFTLPHGLHAFGVGWSNPIAALGVATLEGVFLLATSHFIFGLISSHTQRQYAYIAIGVSGLLLMSNSVLSQLLYMQEAGKLTAAMIQALTLYQGFLLPITPLAAFLCGVMLMAHHPKIIEIGRTMSHVATVTAAEQAADRNRQMAVAEMHTARTEAEATKLRATLNADLAKQRALLESQRLGAEVQLRKYQLEVQEQMAAVDFDISTSDAVISQQIARMNEYLASEQFQKRIHTAATQKIGKVLKRLEDNSAEAPPRPTATPQPFNIETAALPQPVPTSYHPSTNGYHHPNPTAMGD